MKVSVIIPTYNEEEMIGECLESLRQQSYKNMEIIVVDDGSTDKTRDLVSGVELLTQRHGGPGEARNLGAKEARGDILVFVDADMTFDKDFVKNLIKPIINKDSKGTFSKDEYVSNFSNIWAKCWSLNKGIISDKMHPKNYPDTQKVFRAILKSEFDKVSGFDVGGYYTDDWSLSEKLGYEATVSGGKFYHQNPSNLSEVFNQAKWAAKRPYKLGILGNLVALIRSSLPVSIIFGSIKSIAHQNFNFLIFKIIYDLGAFIGITSFTIFAKGAK